MRPHVDAHSPIPIRWQLAEQLKQVIEARRRPAGPCAARYPGAGRIHRHQSEHGRASEAERARGGAAGKGVFVAPALAVRPFLTPREDFLKDAVIRATALEMTPDDVAAGVLSVAGVGRAAVRGTVAVLLVECSPPELAVPSGPPPAMARHRGDGAGAAMHGAMTR
jgi:hypothetical protein